MVDKLEARAQEAALQREQRPPSSPSDQRQKIHSSISPPPPPPSIAPPPAYEELTVETCTGPATIRLPLLPNEDELTHEQRIFALQDEVQRAREREEISRMAAAIRAAHPDLVPASTPASPSLLINTSVPSVSTPSITSNTAVAPIPVGPDALLATSPSPIIPSLIDDRPRPALSSSPDSEPDTLMPNDPFRLFTLRKTREPLVFPPLAASKLETLSFFSRNRQSALDALCMYEDEDHEPSTAEVNNPSTPDEAPASKIANIQM